MGSLLTSKKQLAFSLEVAAVQGRGPCVAIVAFPFGRCPEWEGGLGSEEVDFLKMAPEPLEGRSQAAQAPGPWPQGC